MPLRFVGQAVVRASVLVPYPLGVLSPSSGCRGCFLFLFWCLCGGPCCGRGRRLALRAWWQAAWRCSRRLPQGGVAPAPVWVCPPSPVLGPVVHGRELVRSVRRHVRASAECLGGRAPPGVARCQLAVGRCWSLRCGVPFLCVLPRARLCALTFCATAPGPSPFRPFGDFLPRCCAAPGAPVPVGACLSPSAPPCLLAGVSSPVPCASLALALSLPGVVVVGWGVGLWAADGPCLGVGGLEPLAEGFGV